MENYDESNEHNNVADSVYEAHNPVTNGDKFLKWPLVFSPLLLVMVNGGIYIGTYFPPMLILVAVALIVTLLVCLNISVKSLFERNIRKSASVALIPAFVALWFNFPKLFISEPQYIVSYIRFIANKNEYMSVVDALPKNKEPRYAVFSWGGFFTNPIQLIFDESDELSLPTERRSNAWWERIGENSEFKVCKHDARKLYSHFYVVGFNC